MKNPINFGRTGSLVGALLMAGSLMAAEAKKSDAAQEPTEVLFFFDTEDYTSSGANDPVRDLANLFTEEGVRGHFAIVGYLCRQLIDWKRWDVLEALKPHLVGTQTLYHSRHPDICEISDLKDYGQAYRNVLTEEAQGIGMIEAMTGKKCICAVPPGNSKTYVAMYVYADLGIPFYCDTVVSDYWANNVKERHGDLWYCNVRHILYSYSFERLIPGLEAKGHETDWDSAFNLWATRPRIILYCHPNTANRLGFWDWPNYRGGNRCEWGKWKLVDPRDPADTKTYYERLRTFLRRFKADRRFRITNLEEIQARVRPRPPVTRKDVPVMRRELAKDLGPIDSPSLSVADCFQAAVRFLCGEKEYRPGKVHGFLEKPVGVTAAVTLTRADVERAARDISLDGFLPSEIAVGAATVGPADFLFAALELLDTDAASVTVTPREQLGDFDRHGLTALKTFSPARPDRWVHTPEFKDEYLGDRLRWQLWTLRHDETCPRK